MGDGTMLWAGKPLSDEEELRTRRVTALLRRVGDHEVADQWNDSFRRTTTGGRPTSWSRALTSGRG